MKTILIDLDGVLNDYSGLYKENFIDKPKDNVELFLSKLAQNYNIEIFTVRNIELVKNWLKNNNLSRYIKEITNTKKSYASIILDDRAINFSGNFDVTLKEIEKFKPYWKK